MKIKISVLIIFVCFYSCNGQAKEKTTKTKETIDTSLDNYIKRSTAKENAFAEKQLDSIGELVTSIAFQVKTKNKKDFKDGIIPWASIEKPENDLPYLIQKSIL